MIGKMRVARRLGLLALILVMALVGHLWMQSGHDLSRADGHAAAVSAVRSSTHHGGHGGPLPSDDHAAVCPALPSADHRVAPVHVRCAVIAPAVSARAVSDPSLVSVARRSDSHRRSPRSPDHGVVLVL